MPIRLPRLVYDTTEAMAVQANAPLMATYLGHKEPSSTTLTQLQVLNDENDILFETEVKEGVYASAVWAEGWVTYLKLPGKTVERTPQGKILCCTFYFDDYAQVALERYMGKRVCDDARNPGLTNHPFVRTLLNPDIKRSLMRIRYFHIV
jgi:hypothetical protein